MTPQLDLPNVEGIESFKGHQFHTGRFDYAYCGGSQKEPNMTGLADKKVAVIGTGTSTHLILAISSSIHLTFCFETSSSN